MPGKRVLSRAAVCVLVPGGGEKGVKVVPQGERERRQIVFQTAMAGSGEDVGKKAAKDKNGDNPACFRVASSQSLPEARNDVPRPPQSLAEPPRSLPGPEMTS